MTDRDPPKTSLEPRPGDSVWEATARELASSPASLNIMSAVGKAVRPRTAAIEHVVAALEAQVHDAGEQQRECVGTLAADRSYPGRRRRRWDRTSWVKSYTTQE